MAKYPNLEAHKIPHAITMTDAFVQHLMKVAEVRPFLDEQVGTPMEVNLLRRAQVRAITASNQIEGNKLQEKEVTALLKGQKVAGSERDMIEVQNYHEALDYVEQLAKDKRKFSQNDFCDIQKLVTKGVIEKGQSGRIRTIPVSIVNAANGKKIGDCPEPHSLKGLMDELWQWLDNTKGANPFARAFAFHLMAVTIHPFADGNGRSVRLVQHMLLLKDGEDIARFVPSETAIMQQRDRYYSVIRQSQGLQSVAPMLEFLAECFATSAQEVVQEGKALLRSRASNRPEGRRKKILAIARKKSEFSILQILEELPEIPRRTIERDLETLVSDKKLKAKGEKKGRRYKIA